MLKTKKIYRKTQRKKEFQKTKILKLMTNQFKLIPSQT